LNNEAGNATAARLLYLGNVNSPLIRNLALEVKKQRPGTTIDIVSAAPLDAALDPGPFNQIWALEQPGYLARIKGLKLLSMMLGFRQLISKINYRYDAVHMLFCDVGYFASRYMIRSLTNHFVISFFGSDYYASSPLILRLISKIVAHADAVTAANQKTALAVQQAFKIADSKFKLCRFGLSPLDTLKQLSGKDKAAIKASLGFGLQDLLVVCGYNASANQQHETMIEALIKIKNEIPPEVRFIFPISSNAGLERKKHIENLLQQSGLRYSTITAYLSDQQLAELRYVTDIMVQLQRTDQLSGSMQESLFAGSHVITGSWLPYAIFDELDVKMIKIDRVEMLGDALLKIISKGAFPSEYAAQNASAIWQLSSWEKNINSWLSLYKA
jgi:glycosyltransferase involved in cell wall biosynthesis